MSAKHSPEHRAMIGSRMWDSDGFTYRYGKAKGGFVKRTRHSNGIARNKRADKRAVRQAEDRRFREEFAD